jgi:hypothetical protein
MTARTTYTDGSRPEHLADKYRVYMLRFEDGSMVKLHVSQPVTFKVFVEDYILQHIELYELKTKTTFFTANIMAIEKIPNSNIPDFLVSPSGQLLEISR